MSDYNELLLDAYKGEVFGDALFGVMAERVEFATHADTLRILSTIESRTAAVLRPLVDDAGIDRSDEEETRAQGRELGGAPGDWDGFLKALHDALPNFLANFVRLRELSDDPHGHALTALVSHEQAINAFVELEMAGHSDISQSVLTRYLESVR